MSRDLVSTLLGPQGHVRPTSRPTPRPSSPYARRSPRRCATPATATSRRPVFEDTELFARGVGESTDIVTKEMYTFDDQGRPLADPAPRGHRRRAARGARAQPPPRAAAGQALVLRLVLPLRAPAGRPLPPLLPGRRRGDRRRGPGARRRGDHSSPTTATARSACTELPAPAQLARRQGVPPGLPRRRCRTSCAASTSTRTPGARVEINPLRVLDDKRPEVQAQLADAPLLLDHLCDACAEHYARGARAAARRRGVAFEDDPRLVRGLDYYTRTTFEFVHDGLGAQSGDRRRRPLRRALRDDRRPGAARRRLGLGVDRTVLALEAEGVELGPPAPASTCTSSRSARRRGRRLLRSVTELRRRGVARRLRRTAAGA